MSGMKNRMMLGMVVLLFLALPASPGICAETVPGPIDTPRAREIWAQAPKTPEDLLRVLKSFMEYPQMSGFEIGEKIFGLDREAWGPIASVAANGPGKQRKLYVPFLRGGGQKGPPYKQIQLPTPYYFGGEGDITLDENDGLISLHISRFKDTFCLTPALTREILGEPTKIDLGEYGLTLTYDIVMAPKKYVILLAYKTMNIKLPRVRNYSRTIIKEQEKFSKIFEDRKNSCATWVSIIKKQ